MEFIKNIKGAFAAEASDRGDLVQTVLIIAGFAVVAILVVTWIGNAISGQAANVAACIAGANDPHSDKVNKTCTSDTYDVKGATSYVIQGGRTGRF